MLRESYFLHTSSKSNWFVAKCRDVKGGSRISNLCDRKRSWDKIFQYFLELFLSEAKRRCYLQPSAIAYLRCAHCANGLLKQAQEHFVCGSFFLTIWTKNRGAKRVLYLQEISKYSLDGFITDIGHR